jgi:hypothetical protein
MKEINKYCKIYCNLSHKKWPELIPHMENWMNTTVADSVGYTPVELMYNQSRPDLFVKLLNKTKDQNPDVESLQEKITKAYTRMKEKAIKRKKKKKKGSTVREPKINEKVLLRCQHNSDAVQGVTSKFVQNYSGPWLISDNFAINL